MSARLRGQLEIEREAGPIQPGREASLQARVRELEAIKYGLNRVEAGVGRYVILGVPFSFEGPVKPVKVHPQQVAEDLAQVRKASEKIRRRRVRTLRFDVRNSLDAISCAVI